VDRQLDGEAGLPGAPHERLEAGEAGLRRARRGVVLGLEEPEQPAHLAERLAPDPLDLPGRLGRALGVARQDAAGAAGLHDHHAHAVGDDVVHLARDAAALLGHRRLRLALVRLLGEDGRLVQLGGEPRARPQRPPGEERADDEAAGEQEVADDDVALTGEVHRGDGDERDREPPDRAVGPRADAVGHEDQAEEAGDDVVGAEQPHRLHGHRAEEREEGAERPAPPQDDGDAGERADDVVEPHGADRVGGRAGRDEAHDDERRAGDVVDDLQARPAEQRPHAGTSRGSSARTRWPPRERGPAWTSPP
jgi:hypothetical protein